MKVRKTSVKKKSSLRRNCFRKGAIDSRSLSIQRKKDAPLVAYSSISFSAPKDTTNLNIEQQFMDEIIEKAKKSSPIGTEKTWGSKVYIKAGIG